MKKVLLTATVQSHIAQFHRPLAEVLHEHGYELHVAARNNLGEKNGLSLDFADKVFDVPFSRSPKSPDNVKAYFQLKKILAADTYEVVHCNTPMGGIITRLAAMRWFTAIRLWAGLLPGLPRLKRESRGREYSIRRMAFISIREGH